MMHTTRRSAIVAFRSAKVALFRASGLHRQPPACARYFRGAKGDYAPLAICLLLLLCPLAASGQQPAGNNTKPSYTLQSWKTIRLSDEFFSEGAAVGDFNRDGHPDVVSGPYWYAGPDYSRRQAYYPPKPFDPHAYSDNFFTYTGDFNQDGWTDILVYGFPGKDASWYENPRGAERFWTRHVALEVVDNESPTFVDLTGDGQREIVCSQGGYFGYARPDAQDPSRPWKFHRISENVAGGQFTHGLGVGDVNGDGRPDLLEKGGWWEQPASLDGDPVWKRHEVAFSGPGGAQMYAYDLDGDGDNDVITSLAAHGFGLSWYEQVLTDGQRDWRRHDILGSRAEENRYGVKFSQLHAIDLADIDGDGLLDIVTGKRYWAHGPRGDAEPDAPAVVYWFRTVRGVEGQPGGVDFIPHLIHDDSGVGVELKVADANGDGLPDVVVGNKKGAFVHLQSRRQVERDEWLRAQPLPLDQAAQPRTSELPSDSGLTPQEAAQAITLPAGFHARLIAGEPVVHQPVALAIDHRGRLWIAEAHTYPNRAPEGEGRDRIVILEDADADGQFETSKVFIEGLNLVSGMEVGFGGVWVGAAPYLLFIPDADQDDRPDGEPRVLLDGWGYQDTHETLNGFLWGPDGWLYGCHGVFTHSKVGPPGTPDEQRVPLNAGVWRYHPTRHQFEVFAWGTSNPWGVDFDDHGQAFLTACVIPHLYHMVQGGRYQRQGGTHFNPHIYDDLKTIADHAHYAGSIADHAWWGRDEPVAHETTSKAGGGHAHCGAMVYLGDNWPDQYRNTVFMGNIHGNRLNNDIPRRRGSGFVGTHGQDFLFANDRWFRAINMKYGPDGGVYLIDWYDRNACHRRDPEIWDRSNGRVFKVVFGDERPRAVDLAGLTDQELVELQRHRNDWYVRTARRILQQRAAEGQLSDGARGQLLELFHSDAASTPQRLRALWTLHAIGGLTDEQLATMLDDPQPYVRAWSVQLMLEDRDVPAEVLGRLEAAAQRDPSAIVRLYLAAALQRLPLEQRWKVVENLLAHGTDADDANLPLMIWFGLEPLVVADPARAAQLARSTPLRQVARWIYRRGASDAEALAVVLEQLRQLDDAAEQQAILEEVVAVVANRGQLKMPASWPEVYQKLAASQSDAVRQHAQFITVKFGDKSIFPALRGIVADAQADLNSRRQALAALVTGKDAALPAVLHGLLDEPAMRIESTRALARYDHAATPAEILARYKAWTADERSEAIAALSSRASYAVALLEAIGRNEVPRQDLSAFTVGQLQRLENERVTALLNQVWGVIRATPAEKKQQIDQLRVRLAGDVLAQADLPAGRAVYEKTCAKCHRLFGDGGTIGPDITGGNRANLEFLLENLLDPSAVVGRDYQMTVVATADGRVISGLIKEENDSALVLQTVNEVVVVPLDEIEERAKSPLSLMPEGQLQQLPPEEVRDLIAYLGSPRQVPLPGQGPHLDPQTGRVAGAAEGESLTILEKTGGDARPQKMDAFPKDKWSGGDHLWWTGAKPGDKLVLELPVASGGRQELFAVMTKARDYGVVQLSLDGQPLGPPVDLFNSPDVITTGVVSLGTIELQPGKHRLAIEIVGAHPDAVKAHMFGLDYVYLAERKEPAASP
ncbi:MAG: c-type cytochrome [Pirellulaceae bacterium]|nr:c-type cytochrome [Pirellulaceae bacterium]